MAETSEPESKKLKFYSSNLCVFCETVSKKVNLSVIRSWETIYKLAEETNTLNLLKYGPTPDTSKMFQHITCRNNFTCKAKKISDMQNFCLFCNRNKTYSERTREDLIECNDASKVRAIAEAKSDSEVIHTINNSMTNKSEIRYHLSCYRAYTRIERSSVEQTQKPEIQARQELFQFIRKEILSKSLYCTRNDLTDRMLSLMRKYGVQEIPHSVTKNLNYHVEKEFGNKLLYLSGKGHVHGYFVSSNMDMCTLLDEISDLKKENKQMKKKVDEVKSVTYDVCKVAKYIRKDVRNVDLSEQCWPPHPDSPDIDVPDSLQIFMETLFGKLVLSFCY